MFFFRLLLSLTDYLAVDPTNPMAMKRVIRLIESGRPVVIFPEGRITVTGSLMKVYDGPAFVAARTQAVIVAGAPGWRCPHLPQQALGRPSARAVPENHRLRAAAHLDPDAAGRDRAHAAQKAGESMRRIMQEMIFRAHPVQTLYTAMLDAMRIYGRGRKLVEDMRQTEYSYSMLLKMTLMLGLLVRRNSTRGEIVGILMPNLAATLCMVIGHDGVPARPGHAQLHGGNRRHPERLRRGADPHHRDLAQVPGYGQAPGPGGCAAGREDGVSGGPAADDHSVGQAVGPGSPGLPQAPRSPRRSRLARRGALHLGLRGPPERSRALAPRHPVEYRADARYYRLDGRRQDLQRPAHLPLLRSDRRRAAADSLRHQTVLVSFAAALSHSFRK